MKHIPLIFPLSFVAIVVVTFFTGAWAIAEGAANGQASVPVAVDAPPGHPDGPTDNSASDYEWHQKAAIFICPLH